MLIYNRKQKHTTMKEHLITMVYLGLLFTLFNSPFPNRLLETEDLIQDEQIITPVNKNESMPYQHEEIDLKEDSFYKKLPRVAAYADISLH